MTRQPEFVRGLACTWTPDRNGNRFTREAFERSRRLFDAGRLRIPLLWSHDFEQEHGEVLELRAGKLGLEVTARVDRMPSQPGPYGLSVGTISTDADRAKGVIEDCILREISLGTMAQIANAGGGEVQLFDQVLNGTLQAVGDAEPA